MTRPVPTRDHILRGTFRADRHGGARLKPVKPLKPPAALKGPAKKKWNEVAKLLASAGMLTALDGDALANYVLTWQLKCQLEEDVKVNGVAFTTDGGQRKRNPSVAALAQAVRDLLALGSALGLNIAARIRMRVDLPDLEAEDDPLQEILNRIDRHPRGGIPTRDRSPSPLEPVERGDDE